MLESYTLMYKNLEVGIITYDEKLDNLEDWDLWVRYSMYTDFTCIPKTTSIYRTPANKTNNAERQKALDDALVVVRNKHKGYTQKISAYDIAILYQNHF